MFNDPGGELATAKRILGPAYQIKMARMDSGLTQNKLALAVGTTHARICYLEGADDANPTMDTVGRIAEQMGMVAVLELVPPYEAIARAATFNSRRRKRNQDKMNERQAMKTLMGGQV